MRQATCTLTKAEVVAAIQRNVGLSASSALAIAEGILSQMAEALERGESVKITHFGTFALLDKRARIGRNPRSGEAHTVSARRVVTFRPSEALKSRVAPPLPNPSDK